MSSSRTTSKSTIGRSSSPSPSSSSRSSSSAAAASSSTHSPPSSSSLPTKRLRIERAPRSRTSPPLSADANTQLSPAHRGSYLSPSAALLPSAQPQDTLLSAHPATGAPLHTLPTPNTPDATGDDAAHIASDTPPAHREQPDMVERPPRDGRRSNGMVETISPAQSTTGLISVASSSTYPLSEERVLALGLDRFEFGRPCRSVENFEKLNRIDEGTYGVVYRARERITGEIVALKRVKLEQEREGFPLTALREISLLMALNHPNVLDVREIVVSGSRGAGLQRRIFIVMEFVEHDLKALMEAMNRCFSMSEVKCLLLQLLQGVSYLHRNWILHRDLKTSNLLLSNSGVLKIADFGLAREYGSPLRQLTPLVVTLWYRAPELLLGQKEYSTAIDMWSVGCIFAEFISKEALLPGRAELDQLTRMFKLLGTPNERIWPGLSKLENASKINMAHHQYNSLRNQFPASVLSDHGFNLLNSMLTYDPNKRITADQALQSPFFQERPYAQDPSFMPTWPSQAEAGGL